MNIAHATISEVISWRVRGVISGGDDEVIGGVAHPGNI